MKATIEQQREQLMESGFVIVRGMIPSDELQQPCKSVDRMIGHRGMPNKTKKVRTMLSLVYRRPFHARNQTMGIRQEVRNYIPERAQQIFRFSPLN